MNTNNLPQRSRDAKSNFGVKGWLVVIYGILSFTYAMTLENALNYIVPAFAAKLGLMDPTPLLGFSSIAVAISAIVLLFAGALANKKGPKFVVILGLIPSIIAVIIWGSAKSAGIYGLGSILFNICVALFNSMGLGGIAANWFPTKKGLFMGYATMGIVLGSMISNMVMNPLIANLGVDKAMFCYAGFGVVLLILAIIILKDSPEEAGAYPDNDKSMTMEDVKKMNALGEAYRQTSPWNSIGKCLKSPAVWAVGLINGLMMLVVRGIMSQIVPAMASFGHDPEFTPKLLSMTALFALVCSYIGGWVDQKAGTKNACSICAALTAVACAIFAIFGSNIVLAVIAILIFSFSSSAGNNYSVSLASEIFGRYDFDMPFAVSMAIFTIVSGFGMVFLGSIAARSSYVVAYWACAGVALVALIISLVYKGKFEGRTNPDEEEINRLYEELMSKEK